MMKKLFFSLAFAGALGLTSPGVVLAAPGPGMGHGGAGHAFVGRAYGPRGVPYYRGYRGFGLGYGPWWYGPGWGWGYYGYAPYVVPSGVATGGLRLEIEPKTAGVFVDGAYAGVVDDFNGHFQHLDMTPGGHRIEVRSAKGRGSVFTIKTRSFSTRRRGPHCRFPGGPAVAMQ